MQLEIQNLDNKSKKLIYAKVEECVISRFNTRKTRNENDIESLAQRIERNGFEITRALWAHKENGKYEVFAGGNRLEAIKRTSHKDHFPLILHDGYSEEEIAKLETEDNENDEYHVKVSVVDVWAEYARLRDEEGWIQEKIAEVKGATQKWVSERLKFHDKMPEEIKEIMRQEKITEGHLEKISILCVDAYFSSWLTTEQLWIDLAKLAIEKKLPVSQLKKEVDQWKKVMTVADEYYGKLEEQIEIGDKAYHPRDEYVATLVENKAKTQKACVDAYKGVIETIEMRQRAHEAKLKREIDEASRKAHEAEQERLRIELAQRYEPVIYYHSSVPSVDNGNMAELGDGTVDLVFADPPYFLSDGNVSCQAGRLVSVDKGEWDASDQNSFQFNKSWLREAFRILKPSGALYVCGTHHNIHEIGYILPRIGFKIINDIHWFKPNASPSLIPRSFNHATETIIFAVKGNDYTFNYEDMKQFSSEVHITGSKEFAQLRNVWVIPAVGGNESVEYKTQKPEKLLEIILTASSNMDDLIVDPFLGSGTTCVIAKKMKRKSIGYEQNKENKEIIDRRLDNVNICI